MQPERMFHAEWCQKYSTRRGQLYILCQHGNLGVVGFVNVRCEKMQWPADIGAWLRIQEESLPCYVTLKGHIVDRQQMTFDSTFFLRSEIPVDPGTTDIFVNKVSVEMGPRVSSR